MDSILEAILNDELLSNALVGTFATQSEPVHRCGRTAREKRPPRNRNSQQTNPELATQMYQSGSKPALAAPALQSGDTNSQQRAGVNYNPLVSHIRRLGEIANPELATQMYQSGSKPALAAHALQSGNTNSQLRAGVDYNPLFSHIRQ